MPNYNITKQDIISAIRFAELKLTNTHIRMLGALLLGDSTYDEIAHRTGLTYSAVTSNKSGIKMLVEKGFVTQTEHDRDGGGRPSLTFAISDQFT